MVEAKETSCSRVFISKVEEMIERTKRNYSEEELKGKESLESVFKYVEQNGYIAPELPTEFETYKNFINDQIHYWGMNASAGEEEDEEARSIQKKYDSLDLELINSYLLKKIINIKIENMLNEMTVKISKHL